ncbi:hypothetical protein N7499_003197 [Penicillium canescens]|uniref:Uncharacterized protein n=1 Tax=Penicillium canescens TaxID=5083 RepID=A0AAD6IAS8_PENCN|nr:uncharacterized protein N7446_012106 [Penicillium canescens]KAJ5981540.1 hypothetical protein N7522_013576 [Penicillium canescens]KAJ6038605.1 hypothetical protein N7460_007322 [Penicillium canescens]KAJ6047272.1 hypothetical protein N7446_012106 [Penicillium canescens]KAJ6060001.1 hypothetical protein N7444_002933 [Penicillium canescens]KAJ6093866.1 hypothetical protein N7499_003197 [Penicillium canescens]
MFFFYLYNKGVLFPTYPLPVLVAKTWLLDRQLVQVSLCLKREEKKGMPEHAAWWMKKGLFIPETNCDGA